MAFAFNIRNTQYMGPGRTVLSGDWAGSVGDAAGLVTVAGTVISSRFEKFDNDNTFQGLARCSTSTTAGITAVTVNNQDNVAAGYFTIEKLGG